MILRCMSLVFIAYIMDWDTIIMLPCSSINGQRPHSLKDRLKGSPGGTVHSGTWVHNYDI